MIHSQHPIRTGTKDLIKDCMKWRLLDRKPKDGEFEALLLASRKSGSTFDEVVDMVLDGSNIAIVEIK